MSVVFEQHIADFTWFILPFLYNGYIIWLEIIIMKLLNLMYRFQEAMLIN
jgi:hypothetical protein